MAKMKPPPVKGKPSTKPAIKMKPAKKPDDVARHVKSAAKRLGY